MNSIMPRLDLTDSVSIIFSLILLQARAEAASPDGGGGEGGEGMCVEGMCVEGEGSQSGLRHLSLEQNLSITGENCHLLNI